MKKLEIELYRYDNLVFGKVVNQDESLINMETIVEKDDFTIQSWSYPDLNEETLYIRGDNKKADNRIFNYRFGDVETAIKTCKKIVDCVDLINSEEEKQSGIERII